MLQVTATKVMKGIKSEDGSDRPFEFIVSKVFDNQKETLKYLFLIMFFSMLLVAKFTSADAKSFIYSVMLGSVCLFYFSFVSKSLLKIFGGKGK